MEGGRRLKLALAESEQRRMQWREICEYSWILLQKVRRQLSRERCSTKVKHNVKSTIQGTKLPNGRCIRYMRQSLWEAEVVEDDDIQFSD